MMGAVLAFTLGGATTTLLELAATVMVPEGELARSRYRSIIASNNVVFLFPHHKPKIIG